MRLHMRVDKTSSMLLISFLILFHLSNASTWEDESGRVHDCSELRKGVDGKESIAPGCSEPSWDDDEPTAPMPAPEKSPAPTPAEDDTLSCFNSRHQKLMCDRAQSPTIILPSKTEVTCGCDFACSQSLEGCCDDYDKYCYCHCPLGMFRDQGCDVGSCRGCSVKDRLPLGDQNGVRGYFDTRGPDGELVDFFWTTSGMSADGKMDQDNCRAELCSNIKCELSGKPPRSCGDSQMKGLCRAKEGPETTVTTTVSTVTTTDYTGPIQEFTESNTETTSESATDIVSRTTVDHSRCKNGTIGFYEGNCNTFLCDFDFGCDLSQAEGLDCSGCEMCKSGKTKADCADFVARTTVSTQSSSSTESTVLPGSSTKEDVSGKCKNVCNANSNAKVNSDLFKTLSCDSLYIYFEQHLHEDLICDNLKANDCNCDGCNRCNDLKPVVTTPVTIPPQLTCKRDFACSPPARLSPERNYINPNLFLTCDQWTSKPYDIPCQALREHGCDCSHCTKCGGDQGPPIQLSTIPPASTISTKAAQTSSQVPEVISTMQVTSNVQANNQDATQAPADNTTKEFVIIICVAVVALVIVVVVVVVVVMLARRAKTKNAIRTVTDSNVNFGGSPIQVDQRLESGINSQDSDHTQMLSNQQAMHAEPKIRSRNLKRFMSDNNFGSKFYHVLDTIGVSSMREVSWLTMNDLIDNGLSKSEAEGFQAAADSYKRAKERRKRREQRKNMRFQSGKNRHEYTDVE